MTELMGTNVATLFTAPTHVVDSYWEDRVTQLRNQVEAEMAINDGKCDPTLKNLSELMELAVSLEQYRRPEHEYEEVTRVAKIRIQMPRKSIEDCFKVKTVSLYGVGLFAPMKGLLVSEGVRKRTNYDILSKKNTTYDLSFIPEELQKKYDFRLAVPALSGLFVPEKCDMTNWMRSIRQLQYFDIMI